MSKVLLSGAIIGGNISYCQKKFVHVLYFRYSWLSSPRSQTRNDGQVVFLLTKAPAHRHRCSPYLFMFASQVQIAARPTNPWNNHVSTSDTIQQMNRIVKATYGSPEVVWACGQAIANCQITTEKDIAEAIWHYIHNRVRFVTDETSMQYLGIPIDNPTKELLISPTTLLRMPDPQGDCDDFSMLCKAMCLACGLRCSFITIKADRNQPEVWSHVYCKVYFNDGKNLAMDCSHGTYPGWETNTGWAKREWA